MTRKKDFNFAVNDPSEIQLMTYEEIEQIFDVTENDMNTWLKNANNSDNYWYPGIFFDEQTTENILMLFRKQFIDIEIIDKTGYQYAEIFCNTIERHVFRWSVQRHFMQNVSE